MTTLTTSVRQPIGVRREPGLPGPGAGGAAVGGIDASDIVRILQQRIFLILLVWVLGSALTVGITLVTQRYFPLWTAEALVRVESSNPGDPFNPWAFRLDRDTIERNLADQAKIFRDLALLREALTSPEIRDDTEWFKQFDGDVEEALEDLDDHFWSTPIRGTSLLRITMPTRNPEDSPKIVNKIVELYMNKVTSWSRAQFQEDAKTFEDEVDLKERELEEIDRQITELQREGQIPAMFDRAPTVTVRLASLQEELVRKESDMELLRARWMAYKDQDVGDPRSSAELMARVEQDPKVIALVRHVGDLMERKGALSVRLGARHMDIREIDKQLAVAEGELDSLRQTRLQEERTALSESYYMAYMSALRAVEDLRESAAEATQMQLDLDAKRRQFEVLTLRRDRLEAERDRLSDAHAHYLMVARSKEPVRIEVLRQAAVPLEPSRPRPILWIPLGIVLSLVCAVGLALGLSLLDTSLRTPRDVIRHAGLPLLGVVPVLDDEEAAVEDIETAARVAPRSLVAESFRQIRANLLFSAPMEQQRSLLISSASSGEGKTCVAINLGVTLAQGGRRILLIDANFRRPSLHKAFAVPNHRGLSNLLVGQGHLSDFAAQTELPNLDVLVAGPCPPNPAELLSSTYLREALAEAVENYDQVILDGPPALVVSDAMVLAALVDGVVLVCRARTSRGIVQRARTQLGLVGARIIGAVLNAAETTRGGYFRKHYREFYDYMEIEEEPGSEGVEALPPARAGRQQQDRAGSDADQHPADGPRLPEIDEQGPDASFLEGDADETTPPEEPSPPGQEADESKPSGP